MDLRRRFLVASVSAAALAALAAGPALAADDTVSEVVVTGVRESLQRAIEIKRTSENQVDAISASDIGKLPDKNVADALQRLPGVNTTSAASGEGGFDENDRVSVRGTSPSLTQVTIDGHSVSTGDWFILDQFSTVGRSVSFTLLPSEIVASTSVYKTQDASMLEGGVAGAIDIVTRQPLSFPNQVSFEGSAQGAWNSLTKQTKPQVSGLVAWHNPDSTFGVLLQGFYEERSVRRYGQETLGYSQIDATGVTGQQHPELIGVWAPNLIGSTLFEQQRERKGGDIAIQWRPSDKAELRLTGFYSKLNATNHNDNYMFWGSHEICNNAPTTFTVRDNTLVAANFPKLSPGGNCGLTPVAPNTPTDGMIVDNIVRPNASGESYYVNLDGDFHPTDKLTIKGQIGFTRGVGYTPDEPAFEVDGITGVSYAPSGNGFAVTPTDINPQSPNGLANDWAWNETFKSTDTESYGKIDAVYEWGNGVIKNVSAGLRFAQHERNVVGWDRGCSLGADGQCWTSPMPFSAVNPTPYPSGYNAGALGIPGLLIPIAGDPGRIEAVLNGIKDGVHGPISAIVQPTNFYWPGSFKVKERDFAGYLEAHFSGDGWRGNAGVRIVDTSQDSFVNVPDPKSLGSNLITTSAYGFYDVNKVSHDYLDILPSVNLTVDLSEKLFLRMSAAETMSRPDFSALGGAVSLTDSILAGNSGNPNLKPIKAAVYDVALEWYYAPTSLAAVSLFYDDLSSYVTFNTYRDVYLNATLSVPPPGNPNGPPVPVYSTYNISRPSNTSGEVRGVELQVQQPLPYNFGFQANYTYLEAKESDGSPLVGASKNTLNLVGYYENNWLSARLAYTYRSHFLVGLDRSAAENQDSYGTLDGSIDVKVNDHVSLTLDALNLTNELLKYYALNKSQPRAVYENGRQVFVGFRLRF